MTNTVNFSVNLCRTLKCHTWKFIIRIKIRCWKMCFFFLALKVKPELNVSGKWWMFFSHVMTITLKVLRPFAAMFTWFNRKRCNILKLLLMKFQINVIFTAKAWQHSWKKSRAFLTLTVLNKLIFLSCARSFIDDIGRILILGQGRSAFGDFSKLYLEI